MKGNIVSLEPCGIGDYERLAKWLTAESSWYAAGRPKVHSAEDMRNEDQHGENHFMMVVENVGRRRVGTVTWKQNLQYEGSYHIGTGIGDKELFNQGYGAEAIVLLLSYLFHGRNAHRVDFIFGVYNKNVLPIITQWGVTVEGILRDYFYLDGEYHDAAMCSVLRDEFYRFADLAGFQSTLDAISAEDKQVAREMMRVHLEKLPDGYLADLLARRRQSAEP
ncbi:GNAT family protein [Nonomuraea sp. NPDC050643]|uniref:GNAT family N-acetyltransferase n=1 Tax=Nonomuraea sp. NPDC050643 TaxID=3155660 RepID=UPI0033C46191